MKESKLALRALALALALLLVFTGGYAFGVNSVKKKEIAETYQRPFV